ncbi:MAG: PTS sugar transporter subunit IIA [Rhodospirillales bacterium]|nr:PTS sugar transporter subunit IIA [Rhodospirillales bacterium]MBN8897116.1 PTS sugar transporter subunit IIA [Rhodospirillales bacterium]
MEIADLLTADRIALDAKLRDKSQVLRLLAERLGGRALTAAAVEAALAARESLGSTGLGRGFALPHARLEGLERPTGAFLRLARPIDFAAIDGEPVDLVFGLLIPAGDDAGAIASLAGVARHCREPAVADRLRRARGAAEALAVLTTRL